MNDDAGEKAALRAAVCEILATLTVPGADGLRASELVCDVRRRGEDVHVILEAGSLDAKGCAALGASVERAVARLADVRTAHAIFTRQRDEAPPSPEALRRPQARPMALPNIRFMLAVASGKGGVGKSTTAVNLAVAFASLGLRVGLLDCDVHGPSLPRMMRLSGKPVLEKESRRMVPLRRYGVACMSMGFLADENTALVWRGPMVGRALQQMLGGTAWGALDVLVADLPPGTGDAQLTLAQRAPLRGVVIVSTPQDLALIDARKGLAMFRRVEVPVLGVIENMSYFVCPRCGERSEIFGHGGAREEALRLKTPFLGAIPLSQPIREGSDSGAPVTAAAPDGAESRAFHAIAEKLRPVLFSRQGSESPASQAR